MSTSNLIHALPSELLVESFTHLSIRDLVRASNVSQHWRTVALASELWCHIPITTRDTQHADVLRLILARSQGRPLALALALEVANGTEQAAYAQLLLLHALLVSVVRPALCRCATLSVRATRPAWNVLGAAFRGETYPRLRVLDISTVAAYHDYALGPGNGYTSGWGLGWSGEPAFVLPENHPLEKLSAHCMEVSEVVLPHLRALCVGGPQWQRRLVSPNGHINRWFLDSPQYLELRDLAAPPMYLQTEEQNITSSVVHLKLARIRASMSAHGTQNDCAPFFDALQTPQITTLELEAFHGRAWEDFLFSLNTPEIKYPLLTMLRLTEFDFQDLQYEGVRVFLRCFPRLESMVLDACPMLTVESTLHVLMLDSALCPSLKVLEISGVLLNREEPLPFATANLEEETDY